MFNDREEAKNDVLPEMIKQQISINSEFNQEVPDSEVSLYQPSEGNIPTRREEDVIVRHPTKSRSLKAVYLPLTLQTCNLMLDTCCVYKYLFI